MSLLMDALKKAEAEKKQAAKRLQEVEMDARETTGEISTSGDEQVAEEVPTPALFAETAQFSLEPLALEERLVEPKEDQVSDIDREIEIDTVDASEVFSEDLTLENTISEGVSPQEGIEETQKVIDLNDTTIIEGLSTESSSAPFDDTFHGVLFENEEQETEIYEETLPGVPADQLAKDLGGGKYQPTPVAAKTVFSTNRPDKKQSSFKWGVFVVLALLAVGSFAIFYYFTITPVSRTLPSPLIARGIEHSGVEPVRVEPSKITPVLTETEVVSENINDPILKDLVAENEEEMILPQEIEKEIFENVNVVEEESEVINIDEPIVKEIEVVVPSKNIVDQSISESETINNEIAAKKIVEPQVVEELIEDEKTELLTETTPENIQVDSSLINISKSKKLEQENMLVAQAYKAYQDGHYDAAKSIYADILKNDPDNRDAHLGLGAIALGRQDRKNAYSHYVHLLELNPLDTIAMNALISLSNSADPVKDESAIKVLIQRDGDIPALYFSLGNLYAKQQRWSDAQQAFFDAYRLDTSNPDYVINLAISLDQMAQYNTALDYYKTAMDLSNHSSARFDPVQVNNRILALSKLIESKS